MPDREPPDPARRAAGYGLERARRAEDPAPRELDVESLAADHEDRERRAAGAERLRRDRAETQHLWVDRQLDAAIARGDFDRLPLAGKPIPNLTSGDPDWWVRGLVERERLGGIVPESVALRRDDAALDGHLDALAVEADVRAAVGEFNGRVLTARARADGPPVVTPTRDVDAEVSRWRERRRAR